MKFILSSNEVFKSELLNIPWVNVFSPSKILVVGVDDEGNVAAMCGIRSMFNILTLYVCEQFRGRGIGSQILERAIDIARQHRLRFILLSVFYYNVRAFRLYSKFGFKEIVYLKRSVLRVMMLPMGFVGNVTYVFLCRITSLLPNTFWTYAAQLVHDVTLSDDKDG